MLVNASYYWHDRAALEAFARHPRHLEAKRQYRRWYEGYHVVVSHVERAYGDGTLAIRCRTAAGRAAEAAGPRASPAPARSLAGVIRA